MTKFQSNLTIVFSLSILIMAIITKANMSVLIVSVTLIASVTTVLYTASKNTRVQRVTSQSAQLASNPHKVQ